MCFGHKETVKKKTEDNKDSKCKSNGYLVTFIVVEIASLVALSFISCKIHSDEVKHCCNVNYCILIAIAAVAITALICLTVILRTIILNDAKSEKKDETAHILKDAYQTVFNSRQEPQVENQTRLHTDSEKNENSKEEPNIEP